MKSKLILFIAFVFNLSFSYAQFTPYNTTYTADFGTTVSSYSYPSGGTGTQTSTSSSTAAAFLPSPSSGFARVIIASTATNNSFNLSTTNSLEMVSGNTTGGGTSKYTAYSMSSASDLAYCSFNINFNTTSTAGTFAWGLGNYGTTGMYTGSGSIYRSTAEIFTSLRWTLGSTSAITAEYRVGSDASTTTTYGSINNTTFAKGGTYKVEVYANNTGVAQTYIRGTNTYNLPNNSFHLWIDNVQLGGDYPRSIEVSGGSGLSGGTSIAFANGLPFNGYVFTASEKATAASSIVLKDVSVTYKANTLPVSLTYFNCRLMNNGVQLNWQTASEQNNDYFEILRSADGKSFSKIDLVQGSGTTSSIKNYSYIDKKPLIGDNYYQLRQVDFNGKSILSNVVGVESNLNAVDFSAIFKNDNEIQAVINSSKVSEGVIRLMDISGKKLLEEKVLLTVGNNNFSKNIDVKSGVYLLSFTSEGKASTLKLLKN